MSKFREKVSETLDILVMKYPKAFFPKDSPDTLPLRIGVYTLITGQNPEIKRGVIAMALKMYTAKSRYLRALATRPDRVDLEGNAFEPVSEKHRTMALAVLAGRQARDMARAA